MRPGLTTAEQLAEARGSLATLRWVLELALTVAVPEGTSLRGWIAEQPPGESDRAWLARMVARGFADDPTWNDRSSRAMLVVAGFDGRWPRWRAYATEGWQPVVVARR